MRATSEGSNPDYVAIRGVMRDLDGPVGRHVDTISRAVLAEAQRTVPVRSGVLLATLRRESGRTGTGMYWDVIAGARGLTPYLGFILNGTPPHIIRPRRRKSLRFIQNGQVRFAKSVHHPGSRPQPFLQRALRAAAR
jgi:hypothetical protein